jgi:hypothetical protein
MVEQMNWNQPWSSFSKTPGGPEPGLVLPDRLRLYLLLGGGTCPPGGPGLCFAIGMANRYVIRSGAAPSSPAIC